MKKYLFFILVLILTACNHVSVPTQYTDNNQLPAIYPDYAGVTIPVNIAPLSFEFIHLSRLCRSDHTCQHRSSFF